MTSQNASSTTLFSAESYFATQLPPPSLEHDIAGVRNFIVRQRELGRNVVLVTVRSRRGSPVTRLKPMFRVVVPPYL